jgi:hypothetical protein
LYIQRHGRVPEATAKHFMLQLGMFQLFIVAFSFHVLLVIKENSVLQLLAYKFFGIITLFIEIWNHRYPNTFKHKRVSIVCLFWVHNLTRFPSLLELNFYLKVAFLLYLNTDNMPIILETESSSLQKWWEGSSEDRWLWICKVA